MEAIMKVSINRWMYKEDVVFSICVLSVYYNGIKFKNNESLPFSTTMDLEGIK